MRLAAGPTDARPPFHFSASMRVGFDETDAQAVVYYGRYFPYFDRARVEYLRHLGLLQRTHGLPGGYEFVMRRSLCEYEAPARFDDALEVFIRTERIGSSSWSCELAVTLDADGSVLARAEQVLVLIDPGTRTPTRVPDAFRDVVHEFEGGV